MAYEIERKFLLTELPENLSYHPKNSIIQGYIEITKDGAEDRIRHKGSRYLRTVKSGKGLVREESETEISEEEFNQLWPRTLGRRVTKTRYDIHYGKDLIELDIFSGDLEGLVVAEVEFDSEEASQNFEPPNWFGDEITHDERYKNKNLALSGKPY